MQCYKHREVLCPKIVLSAINCFLNFIDFISFSFFRQNSIKKIIHLSVFWQNSIQIFIQFSVFRQNSIQIFIHFSVLDKIQFQIWFICQFSEKIQFKDVFKILKLAVFNSIIPSEMEVAPHPQNSWYHTEHKTV